MMDWLVILLPSLGSAALVALGVISTMRIQLGRYEERVKNTEERLSKVEDTVYGTERGGGLCDRITRVETTLTALVTSVDAMRSLLEQHCKDDHTPIVRSGTG